MVGMKAVAGLSLLFLALLQSNGCKDSTKAPSPTADPAKERISLPLHRFENVSSPSSPGIALDTVTGQYCKTWEWTYKAAAMNGGLDTVPTCLSVFRDYPATGDPKDPFSQFGGKAN